MDKLGVPLEDSALSQERAAEIWWNKQSALRGVHSRQANTYWSIALAAAVMGLVILGHRWQYERRQNQQLRLRLHLKEEVLLSFFSSITPHLTMKSSLLLLRKDYNFSMVRMKRINPQIA